MRIEDHGGMSEPDSESHSIQATHQRSRAGIPVCLSAHVDRMNVELNMIQATVESEPDEEEVK